MKCPHCEKTISGIKCPECGEETPEGGSYCMFCGSVLTVNTEDPREEDAAFDFEDRELCPDGACTGIIMDGRCSECGRVVKDGKFADEK